MEREERDRKEREGKTSFDVKKRTCVRSDVPAGLFKAVVLVGSDHGLDVGALFDRSVLRIDESMARFGQKRPHEEVRKEEKSEQKYRLVLS